jgi:AraC-like DNA-binding protein/mannose-6-phosphate isomerase-like protein (cupin superfamily)
MGIDRVPFVHKKRKNADFEMVGIDTFYTTRPKKLLETDYRLDFWSMLYITQGEGIHSIDFREYSYGTGDLIVLARNQVHSFRVNPSAQGYIININEPFFIDQGKQRDLDMLSFFQTPFEKPIFHLEVEKNITSRQIIDLLYKEYQNENSDGEKLIKALFAAFIYSVRLENSNHIREFSTSAYAHYYRFSELVEEHFTTLKTVLAYEPLMGITMKSINSACRECADISAKNLIINRIVIETKRMLVQGRLKNYEIADALGFDDSANLASFFKRYTQMSMSEFKSNWESNSSGWLV